MAVIYEYLFQNKKGELVSPRRGVVLKGKVYQDIRFFPGDVIKTSKIKGFNKNLVLTKYSKYELITASEEYIEFLEKLSQKTPIITNWSLSGSKEKGYVISGKQNGKMISKKVLNQKGYCLILEDGNEYFVQWRAMSKKTKRELDQTGALLDLKQKNGGFQKFAYVICKPVLFP